MAGNENYLSKGKRVHWLDNLRTVIIFLVVLYHVGGVYESAGWWSTFWIVYDPDAIPWVGVVGIVFDTFMMATMFLIGGYLTPASLKNKTAWEFIRGKFKRLIVPWLIAVFTLIPLYKVIFLYSRGLPQEHWTTYFHITNPNSQKWLWFLPVLFAFDILYLVFAKAKIKFPQISLKTAVLIAIPVGWVYSFGIGSWLGFRSWTSTPLIDFENERLLVYFMAFLIGVLCYRQNVFAARPKSKTLYIVVNLLAWLPVTAHIIARIWPFFYPQGFEVTPLYTAIWHLSFQLSLVSMVYVMVETFRRYFTRTGLVSAELSRNSYGVYIIHVILIGIFGTLLLHTNLPVLVKYPTLVVSTYVGSNLLVSSWRALLGAIQAGRGQSIAPAVDAG